MATPRKRTPAKPKTRTLLVEQADGRRFKITIPATAKVTYGHLHPGVKGGGFGDEGAVLRIYEGTNQTAMFRRVFSFRDLGYEYEAEQVVEEVAGSAVVDDGIVTKRAHQESRRSSF